MHKEKLWKKGKVINELYSLSLAQQNVIIKKWGGNLAVNGKIQDVIWRVYSRKEKEEENDEIKGHTIL